MTLLSDNEAWLVRHGDTLEVLPELPDRSVDAVISDPPYGIDFQGASWDGRDIRTAARRDGARLTAGQAFEQWTTSWATECLRVLKPGGHIAALGSSRTWHRLASGIEDAGFELRDTLMWLNAQGMPKSRRMAGGRGTALKPAFEPIVLARRPCESSVTAAVKRWGTGALNIDETRIVDLDGPAVHTSRRRPGRPEPTGRWPSNVLLTHAPECRPNVCAANCPVAELDRSGPADDRASRYFWCGKASRRERDAGCEHLATGKVDLFPSASDPSTAERQVRNTHPTVKPIALMCWVIRLAVPAGGVLLDPFTGSGTTGAAAVQEQRRFYGIEREAAFVDIARARIAHWEARRAPRPCATRPSRKPRRRGDA